MIVNIITLGCPRNTVDSEKLAYLLTSKGITVTPNLAEAKAVFINTCGFIESAKEQSIDTIQEIAELKEKNKISKIVVTGCLVKRYGKLLAKYLTEVDAFVDIIDPESPFRNLTTPSHLGYIKIAEGCSNNCSYCAIPSIRGKLKSRLPKNIIKEVRLLDKKGIKELNIIAQNTTSWGQDRYKKRRLPWLLKEITKNTKNIQWIRLLYTHPKSISKDLGKLISAEPKICNYIDMPIQHINNRILNLMGRNVTKSAIIKTINMLRNSIPGLALRTSIIVGFPTEKKKEFSELLDFIKKYRFHHLGAFSYSKEENTKASKFREIPEKRKKARFDELMSTQQKISLDTNKKLVGQIFDVIIDETGKDYSIGRAYFQCYEIDTTTIISKKLKKGKFYKVKITDAYEYDLVAEPVNKR